MAEKRIVLIDMDDVIFSTSPAFDALIKAKFPELELVPYEKQTNYDLEELYPLEYRAGIHDLWYEKGLFRNLELVPGAKYALEELRKKHFVILCSSPVSSPFCWAEKYEAVEEKLGREWSRRMQIGKDKTYLLGDILIDDKPEIKGEQIPKWEHILYDRPWNRHVKEKRRITWENWREVLTELL